MRKLIGTMAMSGILGMASIAVAQETVEPEYTEPAPEMDPDEPGVAPGGESLVTRYGLAIQVGGGVGGFVGEDMRDLTGTAGVWEARLHYGSDLPIGVEVAYMGGMQTIDALGLDTDARLLTTSVEGTLRANIYPGIVEPYVFAGMGWTRYDLTNVDVNTSSVEDQDDLLIVPAGVGFAYRYRGLITDVRGTYRFAFYEDLVPVANTADDQNDLDTWSAALHVGYEF
jgi:hypothetical protein